jgi:MtN3 and saliva related transmembrane protein
LIDAITIVGALAAVCTTAANIPQLKKCWVTGKAGDLSIKTFSILAVGLALWIAYGLGRGDVVLVAANGISLALVSGILYFKIRDMTRAHRGRGGTSAASAD